MSPRIVGGAGAVPDAYPAHAQIDIARATGTELCGGTLVAPQWVLTAAHCVTDGASGAPLAAGQLKAGFGSTTLGAGRPYAVDQVAVAPGYEPRSLAFDAALLHLTAPVPAPAMGIITAAAEAREGVVGRVVGWGKTSEAGAASPTLNEVDVTIVGDAACVDAYAGRVSAAALLCAGEPQGGRDSCGGDSGGPLLVPVAGGWRLAGIVSGGDGCGRPGSYGIYTDLTQAELRGWIAATAGAADANVAGPTAGTNAGGSAPTGLSAGPPPGVEIAPACSPRACAFAVGFAAAGRVRATLRLSRATARRLGVGRQLGTIRTAVAATTRTRLRIAVAERVARRLEHRGARSSRTATGAVRARLRVVAHTVDGARTTRTRTVRVR